MVRDPLAYIDSSGFDMERSYFADKQSLKSIVTQHNGAPVQNLAYDYDVRGNLKSRADTLQQDGAHPQNHAGPGNPLLR